MGVVGPCGGSIQRRLDFFLFVYLFFFFYFLVCQDKEFYAIYLLGSYIDCIHRDDLSHCDFRSGMLPSVSRRFP